MNTPPGRAGRAWLRHRIDLAERACEVLQVKLRRLLDEQRRTEERLLGLDVQWRDELEDAREWLQRVHVTGGQRALRLGVPPCLGAVEIDRAETMGVHFPAEARYSGPEVEPAGGSLDAVPAITGTRESHRRALATGVRYAAALRADDELSREIAAIRRRVRALNQRSLPHLRGVLRDLDLTLEEREHAEAVLHRAHHRGQPT